ncbi:GRAM domain-containing protein [Heracleum sosnowskyi]|uniref:GRAM domain-containing protein n=1 Tax=Heracleum sosnowskyi TaxID=360622 RepID=A0AAD8MVV2_9APIA|nr:GRAM domain-containing protein [Heracleum sosnowskyi]
MMNQIPEPVIGIPISSATYPTEKILDSLLKDQNLEIQCYGPSRNANSVLKQNNRANKLLERTESFALRLREHVRLGPRISETLKGKLKLGMMILRGGGVTKVFNQKFSMREGEKLLKASQCYLSTTAGPIAGLLFISTDKVAFCSERTMKVFSSTGDMIRIHYKVVIPVGKIKIANKNITSIKKLSQKYMEIVTGDDFDFWFMGFLDYQRTFSYIDQAISSI